MKVQSYLHSQWKKLLAKQRLRAVITCILLQNILKQTQNTDKITIQSKHFTRNFDTFFPRPSTILPVFTFWCVYPCLDCICKFCDTNILATAFVKNFLHVLTSAQLRSLGPFRTNRKTSETHAPLWNCTGNSQVREIRDELKIPYKSHNMSVTQHLHSNNTAN